MERIGFVGLGRMGQIMAGRLLEVGFPLVLYNRTATKADHLVAQGAVRADSPASLAEQTDIVFTILTDDHAVEQVFLGDQGLLSASIRGKLFVEMSTIRTKTIHTLCPHVEQRGARLLDAPVSGTLEPARHGQLLILAGGAAADLERARPALDILGRRIFHMGDNGTGTTMKLVLNMPMAIFWAGLAEAMAIGQQFGIDKKQMLDVYLDSPVALPALRGKAPTILGEVNEVAFAVTGVRKDLLAMVATGQDVGVPNSTGAAALSLFAAATAAGYGEHDLAFLLEYVMDMAQKTFPMKSDET